MKKQRIADALLLLLPPPALFGLMEYFSHSQGRFTRRSALLTLGIWLGICLVLSFFRSFRIRLGATVLLAFLSAMIGVVNRYKILYRVEPALFSDFLQIGDAMQAAQGLNLSIDFAQAGAVTAAAALLMLLALLCRARRKKRRYALPAAGLALLLLLPPLCTFEHVNGRTRYDLVDIASTEGVLYTAIAVENQRLSAMRIDYDEETVRSRYREMEANAPAESAMRPNVIVVLSESFTDSAWLGARMPLAYPVTPFFDGLIQTCQSGMLTVPKVGGGTSETEFEVLTGMRSQYAVNPYAMGLPPLHSLAGVFQSRGYDTSCIHWYYGVYYNRYNNLRQLGFQSFLTYDTAYVRDTRGMFVSDEAHYGAVMEQMRRTPQSDFVFVLTMQNHGAYDYDDMRVSYGAENLLLGEWPEEVQLTASNFGWLLRHSDMALEGFIRTLEAFEEPTVVIFFGDHIPPLGNPVYRALGVNLSEPEAYQTPYFIWSNVGNVPVRRDLYAWQLGSEALSAAGISDPFFHYVGGLSGPGDTAHDLLSYDALFGRQYFYDEAGVTPGTQEFHIGGEMEVVSLQTACIQNAVYIRPVLKIPSQRWSLMVNGQPCGAGWIAADMQDVTLQCVLQSPGGTRWNEAEPMRFSSASELVSQSQPWPYELSALDAGWEQAGAKGSCTLWKSRAPYSVNTVTALTQKDQRLDWQPVYGLSRRNQYGVDEEGFVWLCLAQNEDPNAWEEPALLYVFEQ